MKAIIVLFVFLAGMSAMGQEGASGSTGMQGKFGLSANLGAGIPIGSEKVKDQAEAGAVYGLGFRYFFYPLSAFEISYDRTDFGQGSLVGSAFHASIIFILMSETQLDPFLSFGVGGTTVQNLEENPSSFTNLSLRSGVGLDGNLTENLTLGVHVHYHYVTEAHASNQELHVLAPTLALTAYWGSN